MKKKILVVDDNISIVNMIKEYFASSKEVEVLDEAYDGISAWEKIEKNKYDCILLDLIMPKKDGIYVLEKIKEKNLTPNIIVLTSYNEQETIRNVSEFGVKYFILKPFDFIDLEKRILDATKERKHLTAETYLKNHLILQLQKSYMT